MATTATFKDLIARPSVGRLIWVIFAIVFFYSGMYFTEFVMAPGEFSGGWLWLWVAAFPLLLPMFFVVNRRYGCATGACRSGSCEVPQSPNTVKKRPNDGFSVHRMPGA